MTLGQVERKFLIFLSGPKTAYSIWSMLENYAKPWNRMAYKNVHKRVVRLHELGLIKQVEGKFKRGAKPYRVTSRGLLELLIVRGTTVGDFGIWTPSYDDDIILQTILYQFFEVETIRQFSQFSFSARQRLNKYLAKCSETVLKTVEDIRDLSYVEYIEDWKHGRPSGSKERSLAPDFRLVTALLMNRVITNEAKEFIFQIVCESSKGSLFPTTILAEDKRFNKIFSEIKRDFHQGSAKFNS